MRPLTQKFLGLIAALSMLSASGWTLELGENREVELGPQMILVELYTSQGCSSCPPADRYLKQLVEADENVLGLGLHVTYWDRLGWPDTLGQAQFDLRQSRLNRRLESRYNLVTPQMIVQGQHESAGSGAPHQSRVERFLDQVEATPNQQVKLAVRLADQRLDVTAQGELGANAIVHLVAYKAESQSDILRGENAGRNLSYTNSVLHWLSQPLGEGGLAAFDLGELADEGDSADFGALNWALIVQQGENGPILSAQELS